MLIQSPKTSANTTSPRQEINIETNEKLSVAKIQTSSNGMENKTPKTRGRTRNKRLNSADSVSSNCVTPEVVGVKTNKAKGRPRKSRLTSVDSDISEKNAALQTETVDAEFLSKLSSPTKKRDSLLGYFPKKESPKELAAKELTAKADNLKNSKIREEEIKSETPKRKVHTKKHEKQLENVTKETFSNNASLNMEDCSTPSGRPKRSCAGKARYDYDIEPSPTKENKNAATPLSRSARAAKTKANENISQEVIIDLDDSNYNMGTPQKTPLKLAPLFMRSVPKPSPDPETIKARREFLQSGVPEKMRLEQAKNKQILQNYDDNFELFPKISHVAQGLVEHKNATVVNRCYRIQIEDSPIRSSKTQKKSRCSVGTLSNCSPKEFKSKARSLRIFPPMNSLPAIENKRNIIKSWKVEFDKFPTYKCYNQLREKYRYFSAIDSAQDTQQVTESFVVTRRTRRSLEAQQQHKFDPDAAEERPPDTAPNGELLFCEKYKPMLFDQVLVNLAPVTQLKEFLSNWSNGSGAPSARNSQQFDDSMQDFLNDSNSSSQQQANCNTVVLLGPGSSGKTNAVFALANEMNFNVLEINAGMKRTGKKLIQELQVS